MKTSVSHPQSNAKVERSHRTMNDILCKLMDNKRCNTWDLHLPQVLAAMRFNYNDSTGQSPFSIVYGRDVILPIDNLLQPRRKYYGEESHQILLEVQHEAFLRVHRRMKKQKAKQAKYADRNARDIEYRVGDPVFLRNHKKTCKLSPSWEPYYRIIEQTSPLTFRCKNQLTGEIVTSHAEHLILAKTEWEMKEQRPADKHRTRLRNVVSDEKSGSNTTDKESYSEPDVPRTRRTRVNWRDKSEIPGDREARGSERNEELSPDEDDRQYQQAVESQGNEQVRETENFYSMSEELDMEEENMDIPEDLIRPLKRQRDGSSSEDDIPLAELSKRLRTRSTRQAEIEAIKRLRNKNP